MVRFNLLYLALCLVITSHGLKRLPRNTLTATAHSAYQEMSNAELSTSRNKAFDEDFTVNDYYRKLTQLENKGTTNYKATIADNTRENNYLFLTTPLNKFHEKRSNEDYNILQEETTANVKQSKRKDFTINEYYRKLTQLENKGTANYKATIVNNTRENNYLFSTTSLNKFLEKSSNEDHNILQKETTANVKQSKPKHITDDKYPDNNMQNIEELQYSVEDNDVSASDLSSAVNTTGDARRIFHGHKTKIKHFPFLVTVHVLGRFICSGSIIRPNLVLTAASCLKRWQEWQEYLARNENQNQTRPEPGPEPESGPESEPDSIETIPTHSTTDFTMTDVTASTATETMETTTAHVTATETVAAETERPPTTVFKTVETVETVETTTDWTTTSPEAMTETTQETSTDVWSMTPPPKLGELAVRIGTNYYRLGGKVVNVIKVYFHPSYVFRTLRNNIAIMRLERHVNITRRRVQMVHYSRLEEIPEGTEVTIAGWGAKTYHNKVFNALWNLIHKAVLRVSSWSKCRNIYTGRFVRRTNFCALSEHYEGACDRDGGNPALVGGILVGVISFGAPKCGSPDAPTVFTNLGYYADWIDGIMESVQLDDPEPSLEEVDFSLPPKDFTVYDTTVIPTAITEAVIVDSNKKARRDRKHWLDIYEYYDRHYRRSQNLTDESIALLIDKQENKRVEEEWSKYDTRPVLTETPVKIERRLGLTKTPDLSMEETDSNNILTHFTKASYDTLDRPDIVIKRSTKSVTASYDFTPHYQGKNPDNIFYGEVSTVAERTTTLTKDNRDTNEVRKFEDTQTDNRLHDGKDYGVTDPYKHQIDAPPHTFRGIKDEIEEIVRQLDLSAFGSNMTGKWKDVDVITKMKNVLRNYYANEQN